MNHAGKDEIMLKALVIRSSSSPRAAAIRAGLSVAMALAVWAAMATPAGGQEAKPVPEMASFTARVKEMTTDSQRIRIPLNRSVIIETSLPAKTVQSVSPAIAVVQSISPTQMLVSGASYGETQVIVWSEDGRQNVFTVSVELDLQALHDALRRIDPYSNVQAASVQGHIVLTGTVSSAQAAERMLSLTQLFIPRGAASLESVVQNHLQVAGEQQVLLRCTVAEVSRSASRQLGINGFRLMVHFPDSAFSGSAPLHHGPRPGSAPLTLPLPPGFFQARHGPPLDSPRPVL